jgi:superfamily I DNA and RNA helicase
VLITEAVVRGASSSSVGRSDALYPRYALMPVIWRKVEDQEERLCRLTAEQQTLLDFLGSHNKAAIRGVAGSGKTILALAKAQDTARRGLRTLFLCYNRPLKDWLVQAIKVFHGRAAMPLDLSISSTASARNGSTQASAAVVSNALTMSEKFGGRR